MQAGIVGMPNVGKSTLFNALTRAGAEASNYPFCTIEPNVGMIEVPDPNLEVLNRYIHADKTIPAHVRIVDIAGLVKGASEGAGLGNQFLSHIREVDALIHVVRCFEHDDIAHVDGALDPVRDVETVETELLLADLQLVEKALRKADKAMRTGDREAAARADMLKECHALLERGEPVRHLALRDRESRRRFKGLGLVTSHDILLVANVDEEDDLDTDPRYQALAAWAAQREMKVVPVSARLEAELMELDPEDRVEMLASLGLKEPALDTVIHAVYDLLHLQSFYTVQSGIIQAWPIPAGTHAQQAAGTIHRDFEEGFIRAEVYSLEDLIEHENEAALRATGKLRAEGKDYVLAPGDVCHFLFHK